MATIRNSTAATLMSGTSDADFLFNTAANVTIDALAGDDTLDNNEKTADKVLLDGGEGNDSIRNFGTNATITAGDGDDIIVNYAEGYRNGELAFDDGGRNALIDAGAGNDTVTNTAASVSVNGGTGNDLIQSWSGEKWNEETQHYDIIPTSDDSTLIGGEGNDSIFNEGNNSSISGGNNDDFLINGQYNENARGGSNVTISGDAGNDTLSSHGSKSLLDAGAGNDLIYNGYRYRDSDNAFHEYDDEEYKGDYSTVKGGDGDDTIQNIGSNVSIDAGAGSDTISNNDSNVSMDGGGGNDSLHNHGSFVTMMGGTGDDTLSNHNNSHVSINGGAGVDSINSWDSSNVTLDGGADSDTITNFCDNSLLLGGDGDDTIGNYEKLYISGSLSAEGLGKNVTILGGAGNDTIWNNGSNVSLEGGTGNDTIENTGANVLFKYAAGDGNDTIKGFNATSTLSISGGTRYTRETVGSNVVVNFANAAITLSGAASLDSVNITGGVFANGKSIKNTAVSVSVGGTDNDDIIFNQGVSTTAASASIGGYVTITAGAGNDSILNSGRYVLIEGEAGNDTLTNSNWGMGATFQGGDGNDFLSTYNSDSVSLDGGKGNDTLDVRGSAKGVTVAGGEGNDSIKLNGGNNLVQYASGDGNDTVTGFKATDTLSIDGGTYSTVKSGNNIIVSITNSNSNVNGRITLSGAASLASVNISGKFLNPINSNTANTVVNGTSGDDSIWNSVNNVTINALAGNDYVWNASAAETVTIDGGDGNDEIHTRGKNATLIGGKGDDSLYGNYLSASILALGGAGNDYIYNFNNDSTLSGGDGNDLIYNVENAIYGGERRYGMGTNVSIDGDAGDDTVSNSGVNVTINAGAGNDSIKNTSANVSIYGGDGNDTITGVTSALADNVLMDGGDGDDTLNNFSKFVTMDAGNGNDSIRNYGNNSTLLGGAGNDTLYNYKSQGGGESVSMNGGNDNDLIRNYSNSVTMLGDAGNDTLYNYKSQGGGEQVSMNGGKGNDSMRNYSDNVTLAGGDGNDSIRNDTYQGGAANVLMDGGNGHDDLTNWGSGVTMRGGAGDDTLINNKNDSLGDNVLMDSGTGDDYLSNYANRVTMLGGTGSDSIVNNHRSGGNSVSIDAGIGDDLITNFGVNVTISGGDGNDSIGNYAEGYVDGKLAYEDGGRNVTITGGKGDDSINNSGSYVMFEYADGDGDDLIKGFDDTSTLKIGDGKTDTFSSIVSGDDVIISVGTGKITLLGAVSLHSVNIWGKPSEVAKNISVKTASTLIAGSSLNDTIVSSGKKVTIDGGDGKDKITNKGANSSVVGGAGNDTLSNTAASVTLNGGKGNDRIGLGTKANNNLITYANGDGNDTIVGYTEDDTISITSGTASVTDNGNDVILNVGKGKISVTGAADKIVTYVDANGSHIYPNPPYVVDGKTITLTESFTADSFSIADSLDVTTIDASIITYDLELIGNKKANSILGGFGNDTLNGGAGNDTLTGGTGADVFVCQNGGGKDVITDYRAEDGDLIQIASGTAVTSASGDDIVFTIGKGALTVKGGLTQKTVTYLDAKGKSHQIINEFVKFSDDGKQATVLSNYTKDTFDVADYPEYVNTVQTIDASAVTHDIAITGNKNANKIIGGDGNDTIIGGAGNDNLTGGKGSDVFVYNTGDGNDLINDYAEEDKIIIDGTVSKITETTKGTVILWVGSNKISVKGGADKVINYVTNVPYYYPVIFNDAGTAATIPAEYTKDTFDVAKYGDYAGTLQTINASAVTHALTITGNAKNNKIFGGAGNDTLIGGKGNDNLNGLKGSDMFVYNDGDGSDTIVGYTQGEDRIVIASGKVDGTSVSGSNVVFTVGTGKIVVKGGTEQLITYVDANGTEHFYPDEVSFSDDGKQATILSSYQKSAFNISDYGSYATTVQLINGAAVAHDISITANSKANTIYGSANNDYIDGGAAKDVLYGNEGNDTLRGGTGNDTLWGGDGADVFLYNSGDGSDFIKDYAAGEKISVTGAAVSNVSVSSDNVVLTVGAGKITVANAAKNNTTVTYYVDGKKKTYKPASNDLLIDDNYSADAAQLSQIVEIVNANYVPYDFDETISNAQCVMRNEIPVSYQLTAKS